MTAPCPIFTFLVEMELAADLGGGRRDALLRAFAAEVESRGLVARGGASPDGWTYRITGESAQATDLDRRALERWAATRPEVVAVRVGQLTEL